MENVTDKNFDEIIVNEKSLILVDFWAEWCGPCRMMEPILEDIANDRKDIRILKVNVDENPELAYKYNIRSIPTMKIFKNNEEMATLVGSMSKLKLLEELGRFSE